jgi:L-threonylcarbamoyladenylate synthase
MLLLRTGRSAAFLLNNHKRQLAPRRRQFCAAMSATAPAAVDSKPIVATIVTTDKLKECGERLRQGELVAFPTETVYGLGCHALDEDAIHKVFAAKERPLTDPLIVHVCTFDDASPLWQNSQDPALQCLTKTFWPGPLTLVAEAAPHVPPLLMAHTGYVACRSPQHGIAQQLLVEAKVPIAAPSANKFGHVSPTRAQHVFDDLKYEDVWIVESNNDDSEEITCNVGVESTVAKLTTTEAEGGVITVLRQGAISAQQIEDCLQQAGVSGYTVQKQTNRATPDHVANVAPGQTIRHYSPNIPSFLVTTECADATLNQNDMDLLKAAVIIDFGGRLASWESNALAYRDLSAAGKSQEAAQSVFETLRWAEQVQGGAQVFFPHLDENSEDALVLAVKDRLTRAASGVTIDSLDASR